MSKETILSIVLFLLVTPSTSIFYSVLYFKVSLFIIYILAYNLRFATRLSKKQPNVWTFIQLIQSEHVRFEHISIQLDAGAFAPKKSTKTKAFQARLGTLRNRFLKKELNANELLSGLSLLIGKKKNKMLSYCQFSLVFFL
jgi:hypothetical protein